MFRYVAAVSLAALPSLASAQVPVTVASGVGSFGGRQLPATPALSAPVRSGIVLYGMAGGFRHLPPAIGFRHPVPRSPRQNGIVLYQWPPFPRSGFGFYPPYAFSPYFVGGYGGYGFPYYGLSSYYSGGFVTGGYFDPYYGFADPGYYDYDDAPPRAFRPPPAPRAVALANEFPATLTLEFPAPAKVWLDGRPVPGEDAAERELTSPVLKPGQRYTFKVRARWAIDGKAYEANREVTLGAGDRSKLLVLAGAPVDGSEK
jgi:uncharacterized protein (TIGR03000 family)